MNRFFRYLLVYVAGIIVGALMTVTPANYTIYAAFFCIIIFAIAYFGLRRL